MVTVSKNGISTTFGHLSSGEVFICSGCQVSPDKQGRFLKLSERYSYNNLPAIPVWAFNSASRTKFSRIRALHRVILKDHRESITRTLIDLGLKPVSSQVISTATVLGPSNGVDVPRALRARGVSPATKF